MSVDKDEKTASRSVVTVACKLPHGLVIRDMNETDAFENVMGGGKRKTKVYRPVGRPIRIKGPNVPGPFIRLVEVVGGYAITEGVDAVVYARWVDANKDSAFIVNDMVFGHENGDIVRGWAKEHASTRSGMEAIDVSMKNDPTTGKLVYNDSRVREATSEMFKAGADLNVA